jgi:rhamnogalacturonan endolyase
MISICHSDKSRIAILPMKSLVYRLFGILVCFTMVLPALANVAGGGTNGPDVTITDNGTTVTMANGIVSILCTKSGATINQINYTYNNGGSSQTINLLSGGTDGGQLYWETGGFGGASFTYTLIADPAANGGAYAEISLLSTSASSGTMEVRFSMLRGSTGFYVTAIWSHGSADSALTMGETRDNIYAGSIFNWMSVDAARNRLMEVQPSGAAIGVLGAPVEVSLWTNGIYAGRYEDKYKYSADFGDQRVWGWSSVGNGGYNVGLWNVSASTEYYGGGPRKRELMEHIGTTILNMTKGSHYGGGTDSSWAAGEIWTHLYGPYFIYCNNITNSITDTNQAAQTLYADALAQASAEQGAWPYAWFTNESSYAQSSSRGTVTGQIVINDIYNPNASGSNLWVGVIQQPVTTTGTYDFQEWMKPYQFWVKTDANGNFMIPNVIAGTNYTLYAFGPGAAGTFQSQAQSGGSAPNSVDIPASPFSVTVAAGATNALGAVTWTPTRIGPTVFEIGYPDRTARKFRHGEDWWVGDIGPSPADPSPIWSKWLEYPFDFPSGPSYTVGQSRWTTDWNFVQPVVTDNSGNYDGSTSTITFNLASAPTNDGSFYIATASGYQGPLIIQVNGNNIAGANGYDPSYDGSGDESDATIREGIHGLYADNRLDVSSSFLQQGQNTITINMRKGGYFANHSMYDYLRLELPGYIPPPPVSVAAYAGNNCNLICWPVVPGATSYNVLRSTTPGSGYVPVTNGVVGPVCGSGWNNATYLDTMAANGTAYYYVVQSVNTLGVSTNSPQSSGVTPASSFSLSAPPAPSGLALGSVGHQSVTLNWSASSGASFYTVYRSTLFDNGGGASNVLGTIVLANNVTTTSYTDASPTDGSTYGYYVTATGAGGTSPNSTSAIAVPLPSPPASAPGSLTGDFVLTTNIVLNWSPVSGAVGYLVQRATSPGGPYTFLMSVTETTYTDEGLNPATTYYYQVAAVNAAGVSTNATVSITQPPLTPISLSAIPGNAQVTLSWPAVANATAYFIYRGTSSNSLTTLVASGYPGTSYTNTGLANGTTYYFVVAGTNSVGLGPDSPVASATPSATIIIVPRNLIWKGDGSANLWNVSGAANWTTNGVATVFNNGDNVTFDDSGSNNVAVTLSGSVQPSLVTITASKNYTLSGAGSIAGTNALVQAGLGTLTINNTNLFSGGVIISNGWVAPGNISANSAAWGTGPITLADGYVLFDGYGGADGTGWGGCTNTINVPDGQFGVILLPPRWGYSAPFTSPLTGNGTLEVVVDYVRDYFSGNWSAFTGQIYFFPRSTSGDFRINNTAGYANAAIYLASGVNCYVINNNNLTVDIGELDGESGALVGSGSSSATNPTWRIGALNTDSTYGGAIVDSGMTSLIKIGTGTLVLSGANNTYSGNTTINDGILQVANAGGSATGSGAVVVNSSGELAGNGIISGAVTVGAGGMLAPGDPLGTLAISNNLTLSAGSATVMQVQDTPLSNSVVQITGTLIEGGTLTVNNVGTTGLTNGDSFQLFSAGNYSGTFTNFVLPPLAFPLVWNTNTVSASGTLSVVVLTSPTIARLNLAGGNLTVSGTGGVNRWPYYLLASTNLTLPATQWTRVATNQFDTSGNFALTNAINSNWPQTFYRLQLQ